MQFIGLYRELGRGISDQVRSIREDIGFIEHEIAEKIASYLASGIPVLDSMEATIDPLDKSVFTPGGSSLLSDGFWVWRYDLAYLIVKYRLRLPEQFIQHAIEKRIVDPNIESKILQHVHEVYDLYEMARQGKT